MRDTRDRIEALEGGELRSVNAEIEALRLDRRRLERSGAGAYAGIDARRDRLWQRCEELSGELAGLRRASESYVAVVEAGGGERRLEVARIVRVMMVFLMTLAVVPFGVMAALCRREYARQGLLVRAVRIAVNNLAGVPSIVFGMFGLGFFVYGVGGLMDRVFYPEALPAPTFAWRCSPCPW